MRITNSLHNTKFCDVLNIKISKLSKLMQKIMTGRNGATKIFN